MDRRTDRSTDGWTDEKLNNLGKDLRSLQAFLVQNRPNRICSRVLSGTFEIDLYVVNVSGPVRGLKGHKNAEKVAEHCKTSAFSRDPNKRIGPGPKCS